MDKFLMVGLAAVILIISMAVAWVNARRGKVEIFPIEGVVFGFRWETDMHQSSTEKLIEQKTVYIHLILIEIAFSWAYFLQDNADEDAPENLTYGD